jgi:hypothetical protein
MSLAVDANLKPFVEMVFVTQEKLTSALHATTALLHA